MANAINSVRIFYQIVYYNNQDIISYILDYEDFFPKLFQTYDVNKCMDFLEEFLFTLKGMVNIDLKNRATIIMKLNDIMEKITEFFIFSKENLGRILQTLGIMQHLMLI